jgi:hypothetical protein
MDRDRRIQTHRELIGLDRDAVNPPADVAGFDRAAGPERIRQKRELLRPLFPDDVALPAQIAAAIGRGEAVGHEKRHAELPAMQSHPEAAVALDAHKVVT